LPEWDDSPEKWPKAEWVKTFSQKNGLKFFVIIVCHGGCYEGCPAARTNCTPGKNIKNMLKNLTNSKQN
jgi:hypothetical protein